MSKKILNNIRLLPAEIEGIAAACEEVFEKNQIPSDGIKLLLYGSRTDIKRKGGDIDLLLEVPSLYFSSCQNLQLRLLSTIKEKIGDQKIDLLIRNQNARLTTFEKIALKNKKLLKQW